MDNEENGVVLATWNFPYQLAPKLKTAIYQIIVGCEQMHPDDMLKAYAKNLRELASSAFTKFEEL